MDDVMILTPEQIDAAAAYGDWEKPLVYDDLVATARAYHEALDEIVELVAQHCYREEDGSYDTSALSTNRDAFEFLVQAGRAEYVGEQVGRRAFIRLVAP